jgi:hypothetical protein
MGFLMKSDMRAHRSPYSGLSFHQVWKQFSAHYLWEERMRVEKMYGKNPNITSQTNIFPNSEDNRIC